MPSEIPPVSLRDYQYNLPENRIAEYPLADRDLSKLLVWKSGQVVHSAFTQLVDYLPTNSTLFFNNTKVIPARIFFEKATGANIEILLLSPTGPLERIAESLQSRGKATWLCTVGNMKRWGDGVMLHKKLDALEIRASWEDRSKGSVNFSWIPAGLSFAEVVRVAGVVPLPPYIKRQAEEIDNDRYQTVFSKYEGAVAAPTAGLHFTPRTFRQLATKGIPVDYLTLHVSAGTFQPIKVDNASDHRMHEEEIIVYKHNIINMLQPDRYVIAVGTTALRTLESIYWFGTMLVHNKHATFNVTQDIPYLGEAKLPSVREALEAVLQKMVDEGADNLAGRTSMYIVPGYSFKVVRGLITNFHQPGSTLLLLVCALIGSGWKSMYDEAIDQQYRFLSYGDSTLLLP